MCCLQPKQCAALPRQVMPLGELLELLHADTDPTAVSITANAEQCCSAEVYDVAKDVWMPVMPLPAGLQSATGAVVNGRVVVTGGGHQPRTFVFTPPRHMQQEGQGHTPSAGGAGGAARFDAGARPARDPKPVGSWAPLASGWGSCGPSGRAVAVCGGRELCLLHAAAPTENIVHRLDVAAAFAAQHDATAVAAELDYDSHVPLMAAQQWTASPCGPPRTLRAGGAVALVDGAAVRAHLTGSMDIPPGGRRRHSRRTVGLGGGGGSSGSGSGAALAVAGWRLGSGEEAMVLAPRVSDPLDLVGLRIACRWSKGSPFSHDLWYSATITGYRPANYMHRIVYDDGETKWYDLSKRHVRVISSRPATAAVTAGSSTSTSTAVHARPSHGGPQRWAVNKSTALWLWYGGSSNADSSGKRRRRVEVDRYGYGN